MAAPGGEGDEGPLPEDALARLAELDGADVVVGIPAIQSAGTIAHVVTAVAASR